MISVYHRSHGGTDYSCEFRGNHEADDMSDNDKRRGKRFTLKSWYVTVAAIVAVVGLIVLYIMITRARLDRRLEALRAAGYPTTLAELAEYNKLPEGAANAAGLYTQAFAAYAPPSDGANTPQLGSAKWPDRGKPLPEPMVKAISQCLADNQKCLSLLHEAAGIQDCDYGWDWRQLAATSFSQLAEVRHCAQLLGLGAAYYSHAGDPNAAIRCIEDGLRLADSLRREPALIHYLVRVACVGLTVGSLERGLNAAAFTDAQLTELDRALTATAGTLDLTQAMITERCVMIETCRNPFLAAGSGQSPGPRMLPGMTRTGIADVLDYMEDCIEASKRPPLERLAGFREATAKVEDLSFMHVMIKMLGPSMGRVAELSLRSQAGVDLARTALAIERYRLATGKLPEQLADLVPQYLEEVPTDPFDGRPIRYKRTEPGYRLYSILEDGQDNGGKDKSEVARGDPYDWPFIVTR
jgi:tetratricopeptide (TPR) repeat protein